MKKPILSHIVSRVLIMLLMCMGVRATLYGQACCYTDTLIINTGYDPVTNTAITPGANGDPGVPDPHWNICSISAAYLTAINATTTPPLTAVTATAAPAPADVIERVTLFGGWATFPVGVLGNWINCFNANHINVFSSDNTFILSRSFTLACDADVTIDLNISVDNLVLQGFIDRDLCSGATTGGTAIPGANPAPFDPFAFGHLTPMVVHLTAGTHTMFFEIWNDHSGSNYGGVAIHGTVTTTSPSLLPETGCGVATNCAVTGPTVCVTGTATIPAPVTGGTWTSSDDGVATVDASGNVTGVSLGVAVIDYELPTGTGHEGCPILTTVTVAPPEAITGATTMCTNSTNPLGNPVAGGTWSISTVPASIATISSTGVVSSTATMGTAAVTYTYPGGCVATTTITITGVEYPITGPSNVCVGSIIELSNASPGGTWISSNTGIATVGLTTGIVGGVSAGTVIIDYSLGGCFATHTVTVNPLPPAIFGPSALCAGSTIQLSDATPGGAWTGSNDLVATVGATGIVTGVPPGGTVLVTYTLPTGCYTVKTVTVNPLPAPITGPSVMCLLSTIRLSDATPGGTWTESSPYFILTPSTRAVLGTGLGTGVVTYTLPTGCFVTHTITVKTVPAVPTVSPFTAIIDAGCTIGYTGTPGLSGDITSVAWGSVTFYPTTGFGTIILGTPFTTASSSTVSATGDMPGVVNIRYTVTNMCGSTSGYGAIYVTPKPVIKIEKERKICRGETIDVGGIPTGGVWTTSDPAIATTIGGSLVTGVSDGVCTLTYTITSPAGCVTTGYTVLHVLPAPDPITGNTVICNGSTTELSDAVPGGEWSSSNSDVATIDPGGTTVYGTTSGQTIITYAMKEGCFVTTTVTVLIKAPDCVCSEYVPAGHIFNALDPSGLGYISGTIPPGNYFLNHSIVVNTGDVVNMTNCVVVMGPGVSITVMSGAQMGTFHSHLFCCYPDMWDGIILSTDLTGGGSGPTGQLALTNFSTDGSSLIEDAKIAVLIKSPESMPGYTTAGTAITDLTLYSAGVTFNKNQIGIAVLGTPAGTITPVTPPTTLHPGYPYLIKNSVFTSREFNTFTGWPFSWPANNIGTGSLKSAITPAPYHAPYNLDVAYTPTTLNDGTPAIVGVYLEGVGTTTGTVGAEQYSSVVVGSETGGSLTQTRNIFDRLFVGIYANNSNMICRNSAFMHMDASPDGSTIGEGIHCERDATGAAAFAQYQMDVYGNSPTYRNEFWDCSTGATAIDLYNVRGMFSVMSSEHNSAASGEQQGLFGYKITSSEFYHVQLMGNKISNIKTGILSDVVAPALDHSLLVGQMTINNNDIRANVAGGATTPNNEYVSQAITVNAQVYPYPSGGSSVITGSQININNNSIDHVYNGISLRNFAQDYQAKTTINNTISIVVDGSADAPLPYAQAGVYNENNIRDWIMENTVTGPGYNVPAAPTPYYDPSATTTSTILEGYHCEDYHGRICSNTAQETNTGFYFGYDNDCAWLNNTMNTNSFGYVQADDIGFQGDLSMLYAVTGNQWIPTTGFWSGSNYQTFTINTPDFAGYTSGMFVNPTTAENPTNNEADGLPGASSPLVFNVSPPPHGIYVASSTLPSLDCTPSPPTVDITPSFRQADTRQAPKVANAYSKNWNRQMALWHQVAADESADTSAAIAAFRKMAEHSRYKLVYDMEKAAGSGKYEELKAMLGHPLNYMASAEKDAQTGVVIADSKGDNIVANYMEYYRILVKYKTEKLNKADSSSIKTLAHKCPNVDGSAIYYARVLYSHIYRDNRIFSDIGCKPSAEAEGYETANVTLGTQPKQAVPTNQHYALSPNPSDGNITLKQEIPDGKPVSVEIWNAIGVSIYKSELHFETGRIGISILDAAPGIYMMQLIDSKGERFELKFVIGK